MSLHTALNTTTGKPCTCCGTTEGFPQHETGCGWNDSLNTPGICTHPAQREAYGDHMFWCATCNAYLDRNGWHTY